MHLREFAALLVVAGCARVAPLPLPAAPALAPDLAALAHPGVDVRRPLRIADLDVLVVLNDPALAAARAQHGVAEAQFFAAGVLPNPTVTASFLPLIAGPAAANLGGSATPAWNAGISFDFRALMTRGSRRRAAAAHVREVDAQVMWQEWQAVGQARLLAVDLIEGERVLALLREARDVYARRAQATQRALDQGNLTIASAAPDLDALTSARAAVVAQERLQLSRRHQLAALLGLAPEAAIPLAGTPDLPPIDGASVLASLPGLVERRPDLAALQAGYEAQDAQLRTAVLLAFPALAVGVTGGSDNSNVRNAGPQVTFDLPIFDRNQGGIAVAAATRAQLRAEYAARLTAAVGEVRAMLAELALQRRELAALQRELPEVERTARLAAAALAAGNLDERSAVDLIAARYTKEEALAALEQSMLEQIVAIATLTGAGFA